MPGYLRRISYRLNGIDDRIDELSGVVDNNATLAAEAAADAVQVGTWHNTPRNISRWRSTGWSFDDAEDDAWTTSLFSRPLIGYVEAPSPATSIRLLVRDRPNPTPPTPGRGALQIAFDYQLLGSKIWLPLISTVLSAGTGADNQEIVADTSLVSPTLFPMLIRVTVTSGDAVGGGSPWAVYQCGLEV